MVVGDGAGTAARGAATLREITSQPQVWASVLDGLQGQDLSQVVAAAQRRIMFTGCGSTHYLAQWAAVRCHEATGVPSQALPASELLLSPGVHLQGDPPLLVVVSRSGETTESVRAAAQFKQTTGGTVVAVTFYGDSELAALSDVVLALPDAQEDSIAQTRAFTAMMLGCAAWITGGIPEGLADRLRNAGEDVVQRGRDLAPRLAGDEERSFFFLGSGPRFGIAAEAMLKMKEMSLSASEAYHTLEFRHGPMSVVDQRTLVLGLLPPDSPLERSVLRDMAELGATTMSIGDEASGAAHHEFPLACADLGLWSDVLYLPALQLLAWERATGRGLDPDRPTNLTAVVVLESENAS